MKALPILISLTLSGALGSIVCPDKTSRCPDGSTCCKTGSGSYGCCPLPNAVCCTDHIHCCPSDSTCDLKSGTCNQKSGRSFPWLVKESASSSSSEESSSSEGSSAQTSAQSSSSSSSSEEERYEDESERTVLCPDQHSMCPDRTTCCQLPSRSYGCCPMPQAVCCRDHEHCCPHGTTCQLKQGTCSHKRSNTTTPLRKKTRALRRPPSSDKICPDGRSMCASGTTCCKMAQGGYGCCPIPSAVCCSDHLHCCPQGTTCDVKAGTCLQRNGKSIMWMKKESATPVYRSIDIAGMKVTKKCGNRGKMCSEESTCCGDAKRGFECCPHVNGVCCSGSGRHCCPSGLQCDESGKKCISEFYAIPWTVGQAAVSQTPPNLTCKDGALCDKGNTCCPNPQGHHYSCCPIANAVCCGDHCCPPGYYCGNTPGSCHKLMRKTTPREFPPRQIQQESDEEFFL